MMFVLSDFEKLAILTGGITLVGIVTVLTACFACPLCWINKKLRKRRIIEDANEMTYIRSPFAISYSETEPPPPYEAHPNSYEDLHRRLTSVNSISSGCSDSESVTGIPLPMLADHEIPAIDAQDLSTSNNGSVIFTLQYKRITGENKKIFPQLRVDLKEARDLSSKPYGGPCNPYFFVSLYDSRSFIKKKRKRSGPFIQFCSTVVKKCQNPVYNESFFFPMESQELKKSILKLEAWDSDKLVNDTIIGEVVLNLKDVASRLLNDSSKELDISLKLLDSKLTNGQLLLGLCYLPTAERMTLAVLKANNLTVKSGKQEYTDFHVQAMVIYCGKIFEKMKTSKRSHQSPVFNEMLMFDIPYAKLDQVVLLLAVYGSSVQSLSNGTNIPQKCRKDMCVGKAIIGSIGRKSSLNHWNAMRSSPRKQIIQWHELR